MPRGRGGPRTGTPGKAYQNRTDLNPAGGTPGSGRLPNVTAPGQPYGQAGAQQAAMAALPMGSPPVASAPAPGAPGGAGTPGGSLDPSSLGMPPGVPLPGEMQPLDAPTDRPDEHLMTGVDAGPGPGSDALTPLVQHPVVAAAAVLNQLGAAAPPQVKAILAAVNASLANEGAA